LDFAYAVGDTHCSLTVSIEPISNLEFRNDRSEPGWCAFVSVGCAPRLGRNGADGDGIGGGKSPDEARRNAAAMLRALADKLESNEIK
jgi:hypothetical protein